MSEMIDEEFDSMEARKLDDEDEDKEPHRIYRLLDGNIETKGKYTRYNYFKFPTIRAGRLRTRRNVNYAEVEAYGGEDGKNKEDEEFDPSGQVKAEDFDDDDEEFLNNDFDSNSDDFNVGAVGIHRRRNFNDKQPSVVFERQYHEYVPSQEEIADYGQETNIQNRHIRCKRRLRSRHSHFPVWAEAPDRRTSMMHQRPRKRKNEYSTEQQYSHYYNLENGSKPESHPNKRSGMENYMPPTKRQKVAEFNQQTPSKGAFDAIQRHILETVWCRGHSKDKNWQDFTTQLCDLALKQVRQWFADRTKKAKKTGKPLPSIEEPWDPPTTLKQNAVNFSDGQKSILERAFNLGVLEGNKEPAMVADLINLTTKQVKQWKADRKKKLKKQKNRSFDSRQNSLNPSEPIRNSPTPQNFEYVYMINSHNQYQPQEIAREIPKARVTRGISNDNSAGGVDHSFGCCGFALKTEGPPPVRSIRCMICQKNYHENCLLWLHDIDTDKQIKNQQFRCPSCSEASKWPPDSVSNNRGAMYKAGSALEATDDARQQWHLAECVLVGIQRIMVHYVGFSHEHNQWLDPELELLRPAVVRRKPRRVQPVKASVNGGMDDQIAKKWMTIAWEKGVLQHPEYHDGLSMLTGWPESRIKRFVSDKKYAVQKAGRPIPQLFVPAEDAPLNEDTRALLRYVYNHGLLETKTYFEAWSALSGLTITRLRRWISDHKYALKKKSGNAGESQKRPTVSQAQEHILSHLALQDLQEGDYNLISLLTGIPQSHVIQAVDYYRR